MNSEPADTGPKLNEAICAFCDYLGIDDPIEGLRLCGPYHLGAEEGKQEWQRQIKEPGCHVVATRTGDVQYVGKESRRMGQLIWAFLARQRKPDAIGLFPDAVGWVVAVPPKHSWLAEAVEEFLIERFQPPHNECVM
jgi:hypothetical protein